MPPPDEPDELDPLPPSDGDPSGGAHSPDGPAGDEEHDGDHADEIEGGTDDGYADELDVGEHDVADDDAEHPHDDGHGLADDDEDTEALLEEGEADGAPDADDLDVGEEQELPPTGDDGGAEGLAEDEPLIDESAYGALDADDGPDFDLEDMLEDVGLSQSSTEWEARVLEGATSVTALSLADGRIVAVGEALLIGDLARRALSRFPLTEPAHALAVLGESLVLATQRGVYGATHRGEIEWFIALAGVSSLATCAGQAFGLRDGVVHRLSSSGVVPLSTRARQIVSHAAALALVGADGALMELKGHEAHLTEVSPPDPIQELLARAGTLFLGESGAVGVHLLGSMTAALPDRTLVRANVGERIVAACFGGRSGQEAIYLFLQGGMSVRIDRHGSRRDLHTLGQPLDAACLAFDGQREELLLASRLGVCVLAPKRSH